MVKVTIYKDQNGFYEGFDCTGHARYADPGQDIVCAGVSALVINAINSVENLTGNDAEAESNEETGEIRFRFKGQADTEGKLLMDSLVLGLEGIQANYGNQYLVLNIKEV